MTDRRIRLMRIIARMNVGGPAVQVSGLMRQLDAAKFEQRLITGYCSEDEADYLETQAPDVLAVRVPGLGRSISVLDDIRAFCCIRRQMLDFRPDVVHTHTAKAGVLGRLAALTVHPRPRIVHTFHGHLLHGYFSRMGTRLIIGIERLLGYVSDMLVAVGPEVRDQLIEAGIGEMRKFLVVEPGLDLREHPTRQQARASLGIPEGIPVVSVLGRITGIKRPDRMIEAVKTTQTQIPEVLVIVAGDGDLRSQTEAAASSSNLPVRFLGWRSDIENVLAASNVTLLTSDNEGTPLSLIQAALLRVPAVATDVGSVRHIVKSGETGWVTPVDAQSVAKSLTEALADPDESQRRGDAAKEWAEAHFSVSRLASDYEAIYEELVHPEETAGHAANRDEAVIAGFGDEWRRFDQSDLTDAERTEIFQSYFKIFPWSTLPHRSRGADFGCGSGRWAALVAPRVGSLICLDPSEEALAVAKINLRGIENVEFVNADLETSHIPKDSLDFGYSLGVLHHIPDTARALRTCVEHLKPRAPFLLYLYYRFDNRPLWFRLTWRASDAVRRVISSLPYRGRYLASQVVAVSVYWPLARLAALVERSGRNVDDMPLSFYRHRSFYVMRTDALDRLGTRLEQRFTRGEIHTMMQSAGLVDIRFSEHAPYWCAVGLRSF